MGYLPRGFKARPLGRSRSEAAGHARHQGRLKDEKTREKKKNGATKRTSAAYPLVAVGRSHQPTSYPDVHRAGLIAPFEPSQSSLV